MNEFTKKVIEFIKAIPPGEVITYGKVALQCGSPRSARQVSYILHSMSKKYNLPWHRVISSSGKISLSGDMYFIQKKLLEEEGIIFNNSGIVDLSMFCKY